VGNKIPISVLVVIHTPALDCLLLERASHPGYWQSVTGSLDHETEALDATACREVFEETGLDARAPRHYLRNWHQSAYYDIFHEWRHRYPPGTLHNLEHVFSLEIPEKVVVTLSPREHINQCWLPVHEAASKVFSPTNREAILSLAERISR
jgi:dATP pyrophosphohydrolase